MLFPLRGQRDPEGGPRTDRALARHCAAVRHDDLLFRTFPPTSIKSWIDANQTALCPACGVDAVIGSASSHRLDDAFLREMHQTFFGYRSK
jgi:hypothetical protein